MRGGRKELHTFYGSLLYYLIIQNNFEQKSVYLASLM